MERKLKYTSGGYCRYLNSQYASGSTYAYFVTDGETIIRLDDCLIWETVFPIDEFDEIVSACQHGSGTDEAEGWELITQDQLPADCQDISTWEPLFETDEAQEEYYEMEG